MDKLKRDSEMSEQVDLAIGELDTLYTRLNFTRKTLHSQTYYVSSFKISGN